MMWGVIALSILGIAATPLTAEATPQIAAQEQNTVTVQGTASVAYMPSQAVIRVTVIKNNPRAQAARRNAATVMRNLSAIIQTQHNITSENWSATNFTVMPRTRQIGRDPKTGEYLYETYFEASQKVTVTTSIEKAAELADDMLNVDSGLRMDGISYTIPAAEKARLFRETRMKALANAVQVAHEQALLLGVTITGIKTWSTPIAPSSPSGGRTFSREMAGMAADSNTMPVLHGGEEVLEVHVSVTFYHSPAQQ